MSDNGKPGGVLATLPTTSDRNAWSDDESAAIEAAGLVFKFTYGERSGETVLAPRAVVAQFLHLADRTGLDPLARQLYCIGRQGRDGVEWSIQTGIDGFRVVAERSRLYAGQDPAEWMTASGEWVDTWIRELHGQRDDQGRVLANAHPLAARVRVYRHDWRDDKPAVGVATWDEYVQTKRDGSPTKMWEERGPGQLAKCAEALSLRKAFPQDLSGLYTSDEIGDRLSGVEESEPMRGPRKSRVTRQEEPEGIDVPVEASDAATGRTGPEDAGSEDVVDAVVVDDSLFACARCGTPGVAVEEGAICVPCEDEVEAEIAAEAAGREQGK